MFCHGPDALDLSSINETLLATNGPDIQSKRLGIKQILKST